MENQRQLIIDKLKILQNRVRNQGLFKYVSIYLIFEFTILAVLYIAIRLFPFSFTILHITISTVGFAVVLGIYLGFQQREELSEIATIVDDYMQLKDRINTSLEVIQKNNEGEIVDLQIDDSVEAMTDLDPKEIIPYVMPPFLKWSSIPILIIAFSFAVPRQYELPKPLSAAEHNAIDKTIANLTEQSKSVSNPKIGDEISNTIEKLKKVTNANAAHEHLHALNREVRNQKSELPNEEAIAQTTQTTQHFKDMDTTALAEKLNRLSEQPELTPELRNQLTKLFAKLSENIPQGKLRQSLEQTQGKTVSPDTLQEIADALLQANQLTLLEEQLIDSRKEIALANIETSKSSGGIASSDSAPGQEVGKKETQGTQVEINKGNFNPMTDNTGPSVPNNTPSEPLIGDEPPSIQISGNELTIKPKDTSKTQSITRVYAGNTANQGTEPDYIPFSDVVLTAQREYAQAIENNRIPLRYRSQIKSYLEAIAKVNEKQAD